MGIASSRSSPAISTIAEPVLTKSHKGFLAAYPQMMGTKMRYIVRWFSIALAMFCLSGAVAVWQPAAAAELLRRETPRRVVPEAQRQPTIQNWTPKAPDLPQGTVVFEPKHQEEFGSFEF